MHHRIFVKCFIYLFPLHSLKSSVMTTFKTCAAEEPPVGYFEARRIPRAELLRDALVSPAPERKRSAQCGRTIDSHRGLQPASTHYCYLIMNLCSSVCNLQMRPAVQNVKGAGRLSRVQVSTMALEDNLMVAGGFQGELICKVVGGARSLQTHQCLFSSEFH
jgi:hypothetical protein